MEALLSNLVPLAVFPLGLSLELLLVALLLWRRRGLAFALVLLGLGVLGIASSPAFSNYLCASLERHYAPVPPAESPPADAIVVLGGGISAAAVPGLDLDLGDTADRVRHAARLFLAAKAPVVIASGGVLPWLSVAGPEAPLMAQLLREWGVPEPVILLESDSRNTRENALNTKRLLTERGIGSVLLVTSAQHMPRALGAFRALGVEAIPSPTDFQAGHLALPPALRYLPDAEALSRSTLAAREYLGLLYYWLRGWLGPAAA
jgi:uncharacterized SAM-binding protein YcdF (DUF218 family)